jgi:hypothetical protein
MRRTALCTIGMAFLCAFQTAPAQAQTRVFVAAQGSDANPCTFALPCRTFQHAHDTVAAGGEIDVLDPAGYGTVYITKAISIQGHGFAGISAPGANPAININAGPSADINLRGLLIDGAGTGDAGILFQTGASWNIQDTLVRGFTGLGIDFEPTTASTLVMSSTLVADNGDVGVYVGPIGSNTVTASLNRVGADNNRIGIVIDGGHSTGIVKATITNSLAHKNSQNGLQAVTSSGLAPVNLMVVNSIAANNGTFGILSSGEGAVIRVRHSTITGNNIGVMGVGAGQLISFGDNSNAGNVTDGAPTVTVPLQ